MRSKGTGEDQLNWKEKERQRKTLFCTNKTIKKTRCQRLGVHICKNHVVYRSTVHCTGFDIVVNTPNGMKQLTIYNRIC